MGQCAPDKDGGKGDCHHHQEESQPPVEASSSCSTVGIDAEASTSANSSTIQTGDSQHQPQFQEASVNTLAKHRLPDFATISKAHITDYMKRLFTLAAKSNHGIIATVELEGMLYQSGLHFPSLVISRILRAVDVHDNGTVLFEDYMRAVHVVCQGSGILDEAVPCEGSNGLADDAKTEGVAMAQMTTVCKDAVCSRVSARNNDATMMASGTARSRRARKIADAAAGLSCTATTEKLRPFRRTDQTDKLEPSHSQMRAWQLLEVLQQCEQKRKQDARRQAQLLFNGPSGELQSSVAQAMPKLYAPSSRPRALSAPSA